MPVYLRILTVWKDRFQMLKRTDVMYVKVCESWRGLGTYSLCGWPSYLTTISSLFLVVKYCNFKVLLQIKLTSWSWRITITILREICSGNLATIKKGSDWHAGNQARITTFLVTGLNYSYILKNDVNYCILVVEWSLLLLAAEKKSNLSLLIRGFHFKKSGTTFIITISFKEILITTSGFQ